MFVEWINDELRLYNYLCDLEIRVPAAIGARLLLFSREFERADFFRVFRASREATALLRALLKSRVYLNVGSAEDAADAKVHKVWPWRAGADYYHFASRHVRFQSPAAERTGLRRLSETSTPPKPYKKLRSALAKLPAPASLSEYRLGAILGGRRSTREFSSTALSLHDLSTLLAWTWGKTNELVDPVLGPFLLKTSPSAGARHPTEVYVAVQRVEGVAKGVYHYDVQRHGLRQVRAAVTARQLQHAAGDQPWVARAAVVFFMTAVIARTAWKYRHSHAYRVLFLDAGHLGQTFQMVSTALTLASFTTAALHSKAVEDLLDIDGVAEVPLYAAAAGHYPALSEARSPDRLLA